MRLLLMQLSAVFPMILSLIAPSAVSAQDQQVSLRFVSFPKLIDPKPVELVTGEGKTIEVELPSNSLSQAYKVPRLRSWVLGKTVTGGDGKPSFKNYGQINSGSSPNQLVMVVRKGKTDEEGFDLVCFDGDAGGFSGGKYIFLNGSKVDVAGEVGNLKFAIKPQKHVLLAPKPSEQKGDNKYLYVTIYYRKGNEANPFYTSTWPYSDKVRTMVLFHHDPHTNQLCTHSIEDFLLK